MTTTNAKATPIKPHSLSELRAILSEDIDRVRAGEATAANVNAVSNAIGKFISTVKLEMEYQRLAGKTPNIALLDDGEDPAAGAPAPR